MIRTLLDTNVLVSSLLSPAAVPGQLLQAWRGDLFELCLSELLLAEVTEVLSRPKIRALARLADQQLDEFVELLQALAVFPSAPLLLEPVVADDPDDDVVLATAVAGQAETIVSGDHHLLALGTYRGLPVLTPRQFLDYL